jgi:hypothetical protein
VKPDEAAVAADHRDDLSALLQDGHIARAVNGQEVGKEVTASPFRPTAGSARFVRAFLRKAFLI